MQHSTSARVVICVFAVLSAFAGSVPAQDLRRDHRSEQHLYKLIAADWEHLKEHAPAVAQFTGDWRWMNAWPDLSRSAIHRMQRHDRSSLAELRKINSNNLSDSARLDYRLFERELSNRQREYAARAYLTHFWQFERFGPSALRLLTYVASEPIPTEVRHIEDRVRRLNRFDKYVDQQIELLRETSSRKMLAPATTVAATIRSLESELEAPPEKTSFYRSFAVSAVPDSSVHLHAAKQAIVTVVKPGLKRLINFLSGSYLKLCPVSVSLAAWPSGSSVYDLLIRLSTTTTLSSEQIHETGLSEVARIRKEMEATARETGFPGTLPEFMATLQSDKRFYYDSEEELIAGYRVTAERVAAKVLPLFSSVATVPPTITARRLGASGPGASYNNRGTILVNVSSPEFRPKFEMLPLMLHEGIPGHHLQKSAESTRTFREPVRAALQRLRNSTAFTEGWGLYAESLGYDVGLYADPYDRFGQLTYEIMRAARMVVDTGIHTKAWSREQAIQYFTEATGKPVPVAEGEISRAIWDPASLVAYKVGELALRTMRREAAMTLGQSLYIRDFHEFVLRAGPLPFDLLNTEFQRWLKTKGRRASINNGD